MLRCPTTGAEGCEGKRFRMQTWQAIFLGLLEGLTEFIPVSSTGHLLLTGHFLGVRSPGKSFEVLIQLGAVLAILTVYSARLWQMATQLGRSADTRRFVLAILVAFLPAAFIGASLHSFIKNVLFETPMLVCITLILGGLVLFAVDRMTFEPRYHDVTEIPLSTAFKIGLAQCLALIPGVSRSGSTIVGALLLGADKRAAAEFSFYLAMPTMAGAFAYDLYKNWTVLDMSAASSIVVGFIVAFLAGVVVVKYLLGFVSRHGFALFAYWRIIVGGLGLGALLILG